MDVACCCWNHISLKNTLKAKQNWQCWIYCLQLFCLRWLLFAPLPWKRQGYLSLQPFYNNVPFLTKQQRKYQVKPLPPSNDQVNSASVFQTAHGHSHVCPHTALLLMRNIQFVLRFPVSQCVFGFFLDFLFFNGKGKGRRWYYIRPLDIGRLKEWLQSETLDGDRENQLPGCVSDIREYGSQCLKHWASIVTKKALNVLSVFTWCKFIYSFHMFLTGCSEAGLCCAEIWKTCSMCCRLPLHRINLIIFFSQIKCVLCSHLQTSCKSLWLVYTPVYSSCRALSPLLTRGETSNYSF